MTDLDPIGNRGIAAVVGCPAHTVRDGRRHHDANSVFSILLAGPPDDPRLHWNGRPLRRTDGAPVRRDAAPLTRGPCNPAVTLSRQWETDI